MHERPGKGIRGVSMDSESTTNVLRTYKSWAATSN